MRSQRKLLILGVTIFTVLVLLGTILAFAITKEGSNVFGFRKVILGEEIRNADATVAIQFKDQNMYNAIVEVLGNKISSKNASTLTINMTQANIDSVTTLDLSGKNITKIDGIEKFTGLGIPNPQVVIQSAIVLNLSNNNITDITPLSKLSNTKPLSISLSNNKISNISPLYGLSNLFVLFLSNNDISSINGISSLEKLRRLNLDGNRIMDISDIADSSKLPNLIQLQLNNNIEEVSTALTSYELPEIFIEAQKQGSKVYADNGITVTGATLSQDKTKITIDKNTYQNTGATVTINGGNADGTKLELEINTLIHFEDRNLFNAIFNRFKNDSSVEIL